MEAGSTWIWRSHAYYPSATRDTGLFGACAGCWWVGRRELGCFQLRQQMGAKNAKKEESESVREQKMMRAQRATLIQVGSCRVTNALLLLLAQALDFLLPEALAPHALGVLGAPLLGATENAPFRAFPPTSSRRTLWSAPYIALPMDPLPRAARSRCCQPPSTSKSSCTALRTSKTSRQAGQRWTDRAAGRRSAEKH